jgi:hypothetical protein
MAGQLPCQICEAEQVETLSQFLLKPLDDSSGMPEGMTAWLCKGCLTRVVLSWYAEPEPVVMDPPADAPEGSGEPARAGANGRGSKRVRQEAPGAAAAEVPEETAAADVAE